MVCFPKMLNLPGAVRKKDLYSLVLLQRLFLKWEAKLNHEKRWKKQVSQLFRDYLPTGRCRGSGGSGGTNWLSCYAKSSAGGGGIGMQVVHAEMKSAKHLKGTKNGLLISLATVQCTLKNMLKIQGILKFKF